MKPRNHIQNGFTLVELSVVLVIVGLLVGALFVGKKLLAAAEVRSTISRLNQYDQAINSFRAKYKYLPGDLPGTKAVGYGLPGEINAGNGDGRIEDNDDAPEPNNGIELEMDPFRWAGELPYVWPQLNTEKFIPGGPFTTNLEPGAGIPVLPTGGSVIVNGNHEFLERSGGNDSIPAMRRSMLEAGKNYYLIANIKPAASGNEYSFFPATSGAGSLAIDFKMDDGMPLQGNVRAAGLWSADSALPIFFSLFARLPLSEVDVENYAGAIDLIFGQVGLESKDAVGSCIAGEQSILTLPVEDAGYNAASDTSLCTLFVRISG